MENKNLNFRSQKFNFRSRNFNDPFGTLRPVVAVRHVLPIFIGANDPAHPINRSPAQIQNLLFGPTNSVRSYFSECSYGRFTIQQAVNPNGTTATQNNWLLSQNDPNTSEDESSPAYIYAPDNATIERKSAHIIRQVENQTNFRYSTYDQPPFVQDGLITVDDLAVLWFYPGRGSARVRGTNPSPVDRTSVPVKMNLSRVSDGVALGNDTAFVGVIAEELAHQILRIGDLYGVEGGGRESYEGPRDLSLTSGNSSNVLSHLDAWYKIKLGWIDSSQYTVVTGSGWYNVRDSETNPEAYILYDPKHGTEEYFVIENRWPGSSIETIREQGLAVWHIDQRETQHRYVVNLVKAGRQGSSPDLYCWDSTDSKTNYDLTPTSHPANSKWNDGSSSNIAIRCIPPAGPTMRVFFDLPPISERNRFNSAPTTVNSPDGKVLDLFSLGNDGYIWEKNYKRDSQEGWQSWKEILYTEKQLFDHDPAVINTPDGKLAEIFALGKDGYIYEKLYNRDSPGGWTGWIRIGNHYQTFISAPTVVNSPDGKELRVLALGVDNNIHELIYSRESGTGWSSKWMNIGVTSNFRFTSRPTAINSPDGKLLNIFVFNQNARISQITYDYGSKSWGDWEEVPGNETFNSAPAAVNSP
ncbi:hypothetical protein ACFLQ6_05755, partial [Thermoproteota archaeon]